ncbi:MAG TPA: hypothetical protein GX714_11615 [Chloroflexi bacterium]|nr:hypothetical protein [Chloroflexota bacterium]
MARDTIRAVRLVYLYDLLKQEPQSIRDLALQCGVSNDTITRDLVDLQLAPMCLRLRALDGRWTVAEERDG